MIKRDTIDLADYWQIIKRRKWAIIGFPLVGVLIGGIIAYTSTPLYQSKVRLLAKPIVQSKEEALGVYEYVDRTAKLFYETQAEIIRSRSITEKVIEKLDLKNNPLFAMEMERQSLLAPELCERFPSVCSWMSKVREFLHEPRFSEEIPRDKIETVEYRKLNKYISLISTGLTVIGDDTSQLITVQYVATDPLLASNIANTIANTYLEFGSILRVKNSARTTTWLDVRIRELRVKLEDSEKALQAFKLEEGVIDSENRRTITSARLAGLSSELINARTKRSEAEVNYNQARTSQGGGFQSISSVLNSSVIERLKETESTQARLVAELSERYGNKHPKIAEARAELKQARNDLNTEIDRIITNLRKTMEAARTRENELERLIKRQESLILGRGDNSIELVKLEREVESNRRIYENFLSSSKDLASKTDFSLSNINIVDKAYPALKPFKPNIRLIILLGLVFGAMVGIFVAFLREHLVDTFNSEEDVEKLGLRCLGTVPLLNKKEKKAHIPERMVLEQTNIAYNEAINHIRASIIFSSPDRLLKTILITSSIPNEGKTTTASNLALSFSQMGYTLLIEADIRKPRLTTLLTEKKPPALLTDVLEGRVSLKKAIVSDKDVPKLKLLLGGSSTKDPSKIITSELFSKLIHEAKKTFDHIVIDTPPLLVASNDVSMIGQWVDGIVMIVKANHTKYQVVKMALKRLTGVNIKPMGIVLSQWDTKKLSTYSSAFDFYGDYYKVR